MLQCAILDKDGKNEWLLPCSYNLNQQTEHILSIQIFDPPKFRSTMPQLIYEEMFPLVMKCSEALLWLHAQVHNGKNLQDVILDVPLPTYKLDYGKRSVLSLLMVSQSTHTILSSHCFPLFIPPSCVDIPDRHLCLPALPKPPLSIHYCGPHEMCSSLSEKCEKLHAPISSCLNGVFRVLCTQHLLCRSGCRKGALCTYVHFGDGLQALSMKQLRDLQQHHAALQQAIKFSSL